MVILFNHDRNPIDLRASFLAFFFSKGLSKNLISLIICKFSPRFHFILSIGPFHMGYIPSLSHFKSAPQLFWPLDMSKGAKGAALRAHPAGKKLRSPHIIHVQIFPKKNNTFPKNVPLNTPMQVVFFAHQTGV